MLKKTTLFLFTLGTLFSVLPQKKKDLIHEISQLKDSIITLNDSISKANRQINISAANAVLFEKENTELRDANTTLLKNLGSFSQISKQNTETVNNALASLKEKQEQMNFITDEFSKNDSTAIAVITQAKQTLGQGAQVGISDGDVVFSSSMDFLFEKDSDTLLTEGAKALIGKIGQIITAHPDRNISVEGLNNTGEYSPTYQQTLVVAKALLTVEGIGPESLNLLAKDGNFKEGVVIRLSSDTKAFYKKLKSEFK